MSCRDFVGGPQAADRMVAHYIGGILVSASDVGSV